MFKSEQWYSFQSEKWEIAIETLSFWDLKIHYIDQYFTKYNFSSILQDNVVTLCVYVSEN